MLGLQTSTPASRGVLALLLWLSSGTVHASGPVFSAILGGSGQDFAASVTSDAQGNIYVAGLTYSPDFPVTPEAFRPSSAGPATRSSPSSGRMARVIWSTYLGGILDDWATGVAVDSAGNVLVAGYTRSANFPLANPIKSTLNNGVNADDYDAFVAKLDPSGSQAAVLHVSGRPRRRWRRRHRGRRRRERLCRR